MLYYKLGRIMSHEEAREVYCPFSFSNGYEGSHITCRIFDCPKWVRMSDAAYILPDEQRKMLCKVHPGGDIWWLSHGFCSL